MKKDYGAIIFTPYKLFKTPAKQVVMKKYLIPKYKKNH